MTNIRIAALMPLLMAAPLAAQTPPPAKPIGMTLQQFQQAGRDRLLERDADGDGKISKAEFAASAPGKKARAAKAAPPGTDDGAPAAGGGMMGDRIFQRFDTNGDGYLDKTEIDAMLAKRFERMDANHDGILTAEERKAAHGGMRGQTTSPEQ